MTAYPTMEEIMAEEMSLDGKTVEILLQWKRDCWKDWNNQTQFEQWVNLLILIQRLAYPIFFEKGKKYSYNDTTKTLTIDKDHPSLISTLHEIGHHLYGPSELLACRFSVQLFKAVFPGSFKKLKVDGHRLTL